MGIRVHKRIGYGLTDLKVKRTRPKSDPEYELVDPRINPHGYLGNEKRRRKAADWAPFLEKFRWSVPTGKPGKRRREAANMEIMTAEQVMKDLRVFDAVSYDGEGGLPNVLLVQPPSLVDEWSRYDDLIDYIEESDREKADPRVKLLRTGIFPWWLNVEDTQRRRLLHGYEVRANNGALARHQRWVVPAEIAAVCKFLRLFRDDETIRTLQPMLYVWWS